jgi:DNA-binding beta-propeller fold protein YncE
MARVLTILFLIIAPCMAAACAPGICTAAAAAPNSLSLQAKITLGPVRGRIDHMAVDVARQRLFVAELGNDSVGIVDLKGGRLMHVISDLKEPQGVGYAASTDTLYVANAGDGSVRLYRGEDYAPSGRIELGEDADNIRIDNEAERVFVGYGKGALAAIDPRTGGKIADIGVKGHPESFQLNAADGRIFVNVPDAREVAVLDRAAGAQIASWATPAHGNFPMALDAERKRILVVFRNPPRLVTFSTQTGTVEQIISTCGDSDDVFVDPRRQRAYVSCGEGYVDVFHADGGTYRPAARVATAPGARTAFFVPQLDRLFVAVRATSAEGAAIWVYRPEE